MNPEHLEILSKRLEETRQIEEQQNNQAQNSSIDSNDVIEGVSDTFDLLTNAADSIDGEMIAGVAESTGEFLGEGIGAVCEVIGAILGGLS